MKKRVLSIILTLAMVVLLLSQNSMTSSAAESTQVANFAALQSAISLAEDGDTIEITAPIRLEAGLTITKSLTFVASGTGELIRDSSFTSGSMFEINSGATVTFRDIAVNGDHVPANTSGLIVLPGGELVFESGAVLQNCTNTNVNKGGGVSVTNGTFTMNSGSIIANNSTVSNGGGVFLFDHSTFTMSGGSITNNNTGDIGGGVFADYHSTFTMFGGSITNNSAGDIGGGVGVEYSTTFTMSGGSITGNHADNGGAGVEVSSATFIMSGGGITDNQANNTGAGVYLGSGGNMKVSGSARITDNKLTDNTINNVYLKDGRGILVTGPLSGLIGVTVQTPPTSGNPVPLAMSDAGYSGGITSSDITKFISDNANYSISYDGVNNYVQLEVLDLWVADVQVTSANASNITGDGISGTVTYDAAANTLTLNNASITKYHTVGDNNICGIFTTSALKIALVGTNTIDISTGTGDSSTGIGIKEADLELSGSGSLTIKSGTNNRFSVAVLTEGNITITDCSLVAIGGSSIDDKKNSSIGIFAMDIDIHNANVTAVGDIYGIISEGDLTINNSTVTAIGNSCAFIVGSLYTATDLITIASEGLDGSNPIEYKPASNNSYKWVKIEPPVDPDIAVVEAAKLAAEGASYANMTQAVATSEAVITEALQATAVAAVSGSAITVTINKISYTAPIVGTSANPSGTNGSFLFTITVSKGAQSLTTVQKSIAITATAYTAPSSPSGSSAPSGPSPTKTIKVIEVPQSIPDAALLTVEPVGEAFDDSVEVRLKEDKATEALVHRAMETASAALNMENAQIFPFDISIYQKGTDTKIQPKEGTSVKITCPIPKELLIDKDKLVVVCVINDKLQVLPITLVTKEGVLCAQFTATHFSPYAFAIDKDMKLADYAAGALSDEVIDTSTKLTATAGTWTKVTLDGIKEGSVITYHVCTPTLISVDSNGNLFAKKSGNAILLANATDGDVTTSYTIHVTVKNTKGGTKVGFIRYYDDIVTYNNVNYRITTKATNEMEGTVAVANNQINKKLPKKVVIPATITINGKTYQVTSIDESAFYNLNKITSVTIPAGVEEISATAFVSCESLKTFTVSTDNKHYSAKKGMLFNKQGTLLIAYPSAKGTIVIDKKVTVIGAYAFSACRALTGVVIPTTVTRIEGCAFAHSKSLTKVTFQSTTVPAIPYLCIFEKVNKACTILVPEASLTKYQAALRNARMPKGTSMN